MRSRQRHAPNKRGRCSFATRTYDYETRHQPNGVHLKRATTVLFLPVALLCVVIAAIAAGIVAQVGQFFFTLDDPYIHLSVAENILRNGVYGINPTAVSSPSSSIAWPFVLLPFELVGAGVWGTFLLNALLAVATVVLAGRIVADNTTGWVAAPMVVAWFFACNIVGLVFTGMEHVAQLLLVVAAARGSLLTLGDSDHEVPSWLWAVLVAAPLIRYENLAVSVPIALWLATLGHRRNVVLTLAAIGGSLGAFSIALWLNGMWLLPSSVVAKSSHFKENGIWAPIANFLFNVMEWGGGVVFAMGIALVGLAVIRRNESSPRSLDARGRLAVAAAMTACLHLAFGRNGWFHRYEAYAVAFTTVTLLGLWPRRWTSRGGALATAALVVVGWQYTLTLKSVPMAAQNIHAQQYQLHRLALELGQPVGVVDLGWVSYMNEQYVYDFYGLGNYDATEHRLNNSSITWMEVAAHDANLGLVMMATTWFNDVVPESWTPIGSLCVDMPVVTLNAAEVRFFAVDAPTARLREHIKRWSEGLPDTSHYATGRCAD